MIRFLLRAVGLFVLAGGFVALLYDGTKSIAGSVLAITPFADVWRQVSPDSLAWTQAAIERHAPPWVWDPVAMAVLTSPAALVLGVIGAALMLLGRRKRAVPWQG